MEDVSGLDAVGDFKLVKGAPGFEDVFLCRLPIEGGALRPGTVRVSASDEDCIAAFSRLCTHMGCHLVRGDSGQLPVTGERALCLCSCHLSSFDLGRSGVPVNAPASACLPQVELKRHPADVNSEIEEVELVAWMRGGSVPYGLPYGRTSDV